MTAKIEWYREVLELEPNSKVFFPLARLLAAEGNEEEAMQLLEKGLARHPEYLEARLFRIELLFKKGRREECNEEIGKLSRMFASYGGFWQAWAACLASDQSQSDTASVLRFLAAHFVSGPLKLHEVLNRGLDAMLSDGSMRAPEQVEQALPPVRPDGADLPVVEQTAREDAELPAVEDVMAEADLAAVEETVAEAGTELPAVEDNGAEADADLPAVEDVEPLPAAQPLAAQDALAAEAAEMDAMLDDLDATLAEAAQPGAEPPADVAAVAMNREDDLADGAVDEIAAQDELKLPEETAAETDELPAPEPMSMEAAVQEIADQAFASEEVEPALPEPLDEGELLPVVEAAAPAAETGAPEAQAPAARNLPENMEQAEAAMVDGLDLPAMEENAPLAAAAANTVNADKADTADDDSQEESFSLRTRSMAEVLAEQGDIQGALEIYSELAQAATSSDEAEDINRRIATLKSRLDMANSSAGFTNADEQTAEKNREKLIGMLEALAQRVEARAQ
ncbi:MAG: hypothetical protein HDQ44_03505 [Desulfovibrio sp.]|nr:hypothetical protein [Desulfovibrio sp.]